MSEVEIAPSEFWKAHPEKLRVALDTHRLDAECCSALWWYWDSNDNPPTEMVVLVITRWPERPNDPPEMLVST